MDEFQQGNALIGKWHKAAIRKQQNIFNLSIRLIFFTACESRSLLITFSWQNPRIEDTVSKTTMSKYKYFNFAFCFSLTGLHGQLTENVCNFIDFPDQNFVLR